MAKAAPQDVSSKPDGSIRDWGLYLLSLSGPASHILSTEAGRGDLVIGPVGMQRKPDLEVAETTPIQWTAFNPFATPAGSPWPRHITYQGNDAGFVQWSATRPIEQITWTPCFNGDQTIDARDADITSLIVHMTQGNGRLNIILPQRSERKSNFSLSVMGDVTRVSATGDLPNRLSLVPTLLRRQSDAAYVLPDMGVLEGVSRLSLHGSPLGQPISLRGIERYARLKQLSLWGDFTDWAALSQLPDLEGLEIRFATSLTELPPLEIWPQLGRIILYNVEETAGKQVKEQMKARAKKQPWTDYASVSQLRKAEWWTKEYGRPFSGWRGKMAKDANAAYDATLAALNAAQNIADAQAAITNFTTHFNDMKRIETVEREDLSEAVWQFSQLDHMHALDVREDMAMRWFDAARDY